MVHIEIFLSVLAKGSESNRCDVDVSTAMASEGFVTFKCTADKEVCWKLSFLE